MSKTLRRNSEVHGFRELHFFEGLWSVPSVLEPLDDGEAVALGGRLLCAIGRVDDGDLPAVEAMHSQASTILHSSGQGAMTGYDVYRTIVQHVSLESGASRPCDQTPRNLFYLEELLKAYPEGRVVVMVRDPRAVLLSQKMKWMGKVDGGRNEVPKRERFRRWVNYHPILTSSLWKSGMRAAGRVKDNSQVYVQRFEDFVANPAEELPPLCAFLGIDHDPAMLEVEGSRSPTLADRKRKSGIDPSVAQKWRQQLGAVDIHWCERVNGEAMTLYGYELVNPRPSFLLKVLSLFCLPLKACLAFLLNIRKSRNIMSSVMARFGPKG